jgi:hypothetical protein
MKPSRVNRSIRIPERKCPHCDYALTGTEATSGPVSAPSPGDLSICINCARVAVFTEDGLRLPTSIEQRHADEDDEVKRWRGAIRKANRAIFEAKRVAQVKPSETNSTCQAVPEVGDMKVKTDT